MYLCPCVPMDICTYVQMYLCSICAYLPIYTYLRTRYVSSKKEKVCKEAAIGGVLKFGIKLLNIFWSVILQKLVSNADVKTVQRGH